MVWACFLDWTIKMHIQEIRKVSRIQSEAAKICNPEPSFLFHFFLFMSFETGPPAVLHLNLSRCINSWQAMAGTV